MSIVNVLGKSLMVALMAAGVASCSGGTGDDDTATDFQGGQYVASEDAVGGLTLTVSESDLDVGDTTGFSVRVVNASGSPVPQMQVSCDTEAGLAIIEPTTGAELTDQYGTMSGVLGCAAPGSLQVACRLPIGVNKRKFSTVRCGGSVPSGFTGFPGAAGGGLGTGGVGTPDDGGTGGTGADGVRLTALQGFDAGETCGDTSTTSIDTTQNLCSDGEAEPFFDSTIGMTIANNSNVTVQINSISYSVDNVDAAGSQFNSSAVAPIGNTEVPPGDDVQICTLFAKAMAGGKRFIGADSNIGFTGVRNVTVRVSATTETGESFTLTGRTALSFGNFSRCE